MAFLTKLLLLLCALKAVFFFYNYRITNGWAVQGMANTWLIVKWSLLYDAFCIALINFPLLFIFLGAAKFLQKRFVQIPVAALFTLANTFLIFLNSIDIFYYRFHLQRADADLLYVLRNPFSNGTSNVFFIALAVIAFCICIGWFIYGSIMRMVKSGITANRFILANILLFVFICLFFFSGAKKLLPTYPLTQLEAVQLPLAQNSLYDFMYSLYRKNEASIPRINYMAPALQHSLFSIHKKNNAVSAAPKNIVLFIMESVPIDFFDSSSPYKVAMPFLDSLVNKSVYFTNAFSYSYSSNKGITAILAGIPTLTDIPLYHSNYTSINRTSIGTALAKNNYSSAFFIGDNYDDFGFAKCCKWLGIQQYYCMQDIPGYQRMEKHSLGLHDEYVLKFMQNKLDAMRQPFLAVQYNISTHYPNDIPASYIDRYPGLNTTPPMKSMQYYNDCLRQFFKDAATRDWYNNAVFIFCSDHWAQPNNKTIKIDEVESFRIPLFIYEPSKEKKSLVSSPVSQLDILNTVLHFGNVNDSIISYGINLTDSVLLPDRVVYAKLNSAVFEAINNEYVLGFNAVEGTALYCYAYNKDPEKKDNLLRHATLPAVDSMVLRMKAFLQTATNHYHNRY